MAGLDTLVQDIGGAVGALFTSKGNAAQAADFQGAGNIAEQNAQLAAASTKIQETQTARAVTQSLGSTQADLAGAGFTMSGSALDIMRSSAQQGALAKSLVNIQGAINENSYAAQAGAYYGEAKAAKEASDASKVNAIASIGGALISGTGQLASAGSTIAKGYNYVTSLFSGASATESTAATTATLSDSLGAAGDISMTNVPILSATDSSISAGAAIGTTDIGVDTSGIALGTSDTAAATGISDAIASGLSDVGGAIASGVGDAVAAAASAAADVGSAVVGAASAVGDFLSMAGDVVAAALSVICTAFYKRGMVTREAWLGAQRYGQQLDPVIFAGYQYWAAPIARGITKHVWFARLMAPVFIPPVNEMAVLMGQKGVRRTWYGVISHRVLLGLSWAVGQCIKGERRYEARA